MANITPAQDAILQAVLQHHYLTIDQLNRVLERASVRHMQQKLSDLVQLDLLRRIPRRSTEPGSLKPAYMLSERSRTYYLKQGYQVYTLKIPSGYGLDHTLAINDVLIAAQLLTRHYQSVVRLEEQHHDFALRRMNLPLLCPDGFTQFRVIREVGSPGSRPVPILWEIDMGTLTDQKRWTQKIENYLAFLDQVLPSRFGVDSATVAFVTKTMPRVRHMQRMTEAVLTATNTLDYQDLFLFGRAGGTPEGFFFGRRFLTCFTTERQSLLPIPKGVNLGV